MKLLFVDELEVVDVEVESESRFKAGEAPLIYLRPLSVLSPSGNPARNAPACNFVSAGPETRKPHQQRSQCMFTNTATSDARFAREPCPIASMRANTAPHGE